uniref:Uncharacterized protein n=1 Tax=Heterorhabditis bacteriophora TaxID=37862 RepID=A0A1I7W6M1_HETBA
MTTKILCENNLLILNFLVICFSLRLLPTQR